MAVDVGQTAVDSIRPERQFCVFDPQQLQHGGVDVVHLSRMFAVGRLIAKVVARAMRDSAACHDPA